MADGNAPKVGTMRALSALAAVLAGLAVLANVGLPALEPLPDAAPLVGNLDEAAAALALAWGLATLFRRPRS